MDVTFQNLVLNADGKYKVFVTHYKAARKLNKTLNQYRKDDGKPYSFKDGEEAVFTIHPEQLEFCKKVLAQYGCLT